MTQLPPIPTANQAMAHAISKASTPRLSQPASPSPAGRTPPPLTFLGNIFAETREAIGLDRSLVQNLSRNDLRTISAGEGSILSILCAAVSGIGAITKQLDEANTSLKTLQKANDNLRTSLHALALMVANETASTEDVRTLSNAIRDVSHRLSASVRYGASGALKNSGPPAQFPAAPRSTARGGDVLFFALRPCPCPGPRPFQGPRQPSVRHLPLSGPRLFTGSLLTPQFFERCGSNFLVLNLKSYTTSYRVFYIFMGSLIPYE